jgi:hypothetical protein
MTDVGTLLTCIGASGFAALVAIGIADFDHL